MQFLYVWVIDVEWLSCPKKKLVCEFTCCKGSGRCMDGDKKKREEEKRKRSHSDEGVGEMRRG